MQKVPANHGGVIANAVAIVAAIAAFPFLLLPMLKLGLVGLLMGGPLAVVFYAIAFLVIDIGPLVGLVVGISGRARAFSYMTAALSFVGLVIIIIGVQVARQHLPIDNDGRPHGAAPAGCTPRAADGAAIGRACDTKGVDYGQGDCPDGYWCMIEVQGRPQTTCYLSCRNDCECPSKTTCKHSKCAR